MDDGLKRQNPAYRRETNSNRDTTWYTVHMARGAPYTSQKLRNDLRKLDPNLKVEVKPVKVNAAVFGCSGFVTNPANGAIVYVSTDHNHGTMYDKALYRTAKSTRDYTGGRNNTCSYADLAQNVVRLLRNGDRGAPSHTAAGDWKPNKGAQNLADAAARRSASVKSMTQRIDIEVTPVRLRITKIYPLNDPSRPGVWEVLCEDGKTYRTEKGSPHFSNAKPATFTSPHTVFAAITTRGTIRQLR